MTHKERLTMALERGVPDQVPVTWELVGRFAHKLTGRSDFRAMCDAHREIGSSIFNLQGTGPNISTHLGPGYSETGENIPQSDGSILHRRIITTPQGQLSSATLTRFIPNDPLLPKAVEYLIKSRDDYQIYADYIGEYVRTAEIDISRTLEARDYIGDDGLLNSWMTDSIYHLAQCRRDVDYIVDLMEVPDLIEEVLQAIDAYQQIRLQAFNESASEVLVYDMCWASLDLVSPQIVRQFMIPRAKWVVENLAPGKYIGFFQSGRIRAVVPDLVACQPHCIQHFDVLGDCDLAEIKRSFGEDICIMGNYNPVVLAQGTVEEARAEARRCLDDAMAGGGYIMSTSDAVPSDARPENMKAVVETVASYGRY